MRLPLSALLLAATLAGCGGASKLTSHSSPTAATSTGATAAQATTTGPVASASVTSHSSSSKSSHSGHRASSKSSTSSASSSKSSSSSSSKTPVPVVHVTPQAGLAARFGRAALAKSQQSQAGKALPPSSPFIRAADAICHQYRQEVVGLNNATSLTATEAVRTTVINDARSAVTQLQALSPPGADAGLFQTFTSNTSNAITAFGAAQAESSSTVESAGVAVEQQDYNTYTTAINDAEAAAVAAQHLGFQVCGSAGSDWL